MHLEPQAPWQRLVEQLRQPPPHQLPANLCYHCREHLPLFVSDELVGQPVDELYSETAVHLDICLACLLEYEELVRLAMASFYDDEEMA